MKTAEALNISGPRYLRVAQIVAIYGLSRPVIFRLIASRAIKSVSVTQTPTATRGSRLIEVASLDAFLAKLAEQQAA